MIFKTNGDFYNVFYIADVMKVKDSDLNFMYVNNTNFIEEYSDSSERDSTYNKFISNYVEDSDSTSGSSSSSDSSNNDSNNNDSSNNDSSGNGGLFDTL